MDINRDCPLASQIADRIREARELLTGRWLERISARVSIEPERVFPSEELLDHVPVLMDGIADYLENPADEISADMPVIAKAMELGELRFAQGFDAHEILKEYEILGGVLFNFIARVVEDSKLTCTHAELIVCSHRVFRAIAIIEQVTTGHYLRVMNERVGEREERLRRFNRMITHELKNRVGATIGAGQLLQEEWVGPAERNRFASMVVENAQGIQQVLENLIALSKLDGERRRQKNVRLREAVTEVFRQLRELARARGVELCVEGDLPDVEVNAAAVELCLSNYVSNAIKYSNPEKPRRWARVESTLVSARDGTRYQWELVLRVRDNGLGVPEEHRARMFERFFRGHQQAGSIEGTGLGLNLVKDTVEGLGGRAWAELDQEEGAVFAFALPCRRAEEQEDPIGAEELAVGQGGAGS